jgi:hypothetical protein
MFYWRILEKFSELMNTFAVGMSTSRRSYQGHFLNIFYRENSVEIDFFKFLYLRQNWLFGNF